MPKVPYPYEVNGKLVAGNGSLIPICSLSNRSLSNRSLSPSLTVPPDFQANLTMLWISWKRLYACPKKLDEEK